MGEKPGKKTLRFFYAVRSLQVPNKKHWQVHSARIKCLFRDVAPPHSSLVSGRAPSNLPNTTCNTAYLKMREECIYASESFEKNIFSINRFSQSYIFRRVWKVSSSFWERFSCIFVGVWKGVKKFRNLNVR